MLQPSYGSEWPGGGVAEQRPPLWRRLARWLPPLLLAFLSASTYACVLLLVLLPSAGVSAPLGDEAALPLSPSAGWAILVAFHFLGTLAIASWIKTARLAPGGGHVMLTLDNFQIDKVPPTRRVAMEGLARQERARGSGTAVLSGFKRMIWKAVLLRVTADGIEVRKAKDPSVLLASIRSEAIEECGLVNDAPEGFHITCKDLLRLQFCGACPGDALCWLRAVMHNAPRAVRIDAEYNAKCAWDVHAGLPRGGEVRGLLSPARCATDIANNAGRGADRCAKQLFGNDGQRARPSDVI